MLKIFGHATSQPTRAVLWLCAMKKLPYELVKVDPMAGGPKQPAFLAKFPVGLIPAIEDGATSICEAHAILQYLATKNKWTDLYPEDVVQRAHVDQYLHWHHRNTRNLTTVYFRPFLFGIIGKNELPRPVKESDAKLMANSLQTIETWLNRHAFIAGPQLTIADISAYCEFDQIVELNRKLGITVLDFSAFPKLTQWLHTMRALPEHDSARQTLFKTIQLIDQRYRQLTAATPKANL